jgi:hypothetical protein
MTGACQREEALLNSDLSVPLTLWATVPRSSGGSSRSRTALALIPSADQYLFFTTERGLFKLHLKVVAQVISRSTPPGTTSTATLATKKGAEDITEYIFKT